MSGNPVGVDNTFRRKFDKEEYLERARQRGREEKEEARKGKDKGPPVQRQPLKHRDYEVDLESRLGKTQAGYYCSVCECVGKDSANYLDHINGEKHQRALGMSMRVERASLEQVQTMFESLKKRKDPSSFSEQAIMPRIKKPALRKGTIPDGDSEERYNPPTSSTGPSCRKAPSKKAASRKSPWDELSDEEMASFLLGIKEKGKEQSSKKRAAEPEFEEEECDEEKGKEQSSKKRKDPSSFSEQAIMPRTKKPALRKGTIPDGDSEERYNSPTSITGPSRRKAPSKKAASRKSPWDELSDEEMASFLLGIKEKGKEQSSKKRAAELEFEEEECGEEKGKEQSSKKRKDPSSFSEQAIMSRTKKPTLRKGTIPDGDSEERSNPPASSTGPSRRKAPSKKAASRKSPWDELSDEEMASFLLGIKKKGKEQSSKKRAAEPEFEEEECDEESDEEMAKAEEPTIDLMLITSDNYALLRHVNQYEKPNSSTDARFHTRFQQEVFAQLYSQHRQFADHKHVDWAHLNSLDKYEGAYRLFQAVGLHDIVALRCDYNEEIIRQFYATVHVSASFDHLIWMTGTQRYQAFKVDFERALRIYMGTQERIEDKEALRVPAWSQFYDQSVNFVPGKIGGLLSLPSLINRVINHTFFPKSGNFDAIRGHAWNIIDNIMHGRKFDVVDLIIREISSSKNDRVKRIYFAPYIMALILRVTQFRGGRPEVHKAYKPREGAPMPAVVPPPASDVPSQSPAAPADQVSLSQMLSIVMEIRDSQQRLEQNQQRLEEAQTETNNRIAALTEQIHTLERARYGRR